MVVISEINFFKYTVADWYRCEIPDRNPDYVSYSGSAYWWYKNKVKRLSDHWGQVATCRWLLEGQECRGYYCAECYFEEFRSIKNVLESTEET